MLFSFMTYGAGTVYAADTGDSWSIYWYLCGSNLESENGCVTMDLQEMLDVELPENVNVIIQTGGAEAWQNELMNPAKIQRWLFNSEGMYLLEEQDSAKLGKAICDAYYAGCEAVGTEDQTTLSLTDLTKLNPLLDAYEAFGQEAMVSVAANPGFYSEFARAAISSENYGGNNDEEGYTNMVDLGHLARQTAGTMKSSKAVLDALDNCVLYRVNGDYRAEATGLSCYYSYNGDVDDYNAYTAVGAGEAFKHFYGYALTGEMDQGYLKTLNITEMQTLSTLAETDWDGKLLDLNEDGVSILNLGAQASDILAELNFQLYYVDEENDQLMLLGQDNDIVCD